MRFAASKRKRGQTRAHAKPTPAADTESPEFDFSKYKSLHELLRPLYVLFAVLSAIVFLWKLPPFMGPDEPNQLRRADQISRGELIGHRFQRGPAVTSGGQVDTNLDAVVSVFEPLRKSPSAHVTPQEKVAGDLIPWSSATADEPFPNTAAYPPLFYLPESVGIALGNTRGDTIVSTLTIARAFNALACIVVGAFALKTAPRGRLFLFCLLLLPMTLEMDSVVTQDGLIIAVSALACAYLIRGPTDGRPMTREELLGACVCLFLVGISKPPYALLAFLLLLARTERPSVRWTAFGAVFLPVVAWHAWMTLAVQTPILRPDATVNEPGQIAFLLHHPLSLVTVPLKTTAAHLSELIGGLVGNLGWLDTPLPKAYYAVAYLVLAAGAASGYGKWHLRGLWVLLVLAAAGATVTLGLYLAYTPVGKASADGVQGRYFLPLLAFLPLTFFAPPAALKPSPKWTTAVAWAIAVGFPLIGLFVIERALTLRF